MVRHRSVDRQIYSDTGALIDRCITTEAWIDRFIYTQKRRYIDGQTKEHRKIDLHRHTGAQIDRYMDRWIDTGSKIDTNKQKQEYRYVINALLQ